MIPPIAREFIAGESIDTVIKESKKLNNKEITPIINNLGEHIEDENKIEETYKEYIELIKRINEENVDAEISIKPTQLGLEKNRDIFEYNLKLILEKATKNNIYVWVDMESVDTIDETLYTYKQLVQNYPNDIGICIQANIKQSETYIKELSEYDGVGIRIVKGAYKESPNVAYVNKDKIQENYKHLIYTAVEYINNGRIAIGTHDSEIINFSILKIDEEIEIQMLRGIRERLQEDLATKHTVKQYIPYGNGWFQYTYRRIRERPQNIILIFKSVKQIIKTKINNLF